MEDYFNLLIFGKWQTTSLLRSVSIPNFVSIHNSVSINISVSMQKNVLTNQFVYIAMFCILVIFLKWPSFFLNVAMGSIGWLNDPNYFMILCFHNHIDNLLYMKDDLRWKILHSWTYVWLGWAWLTLCFFFVFPLVRITLGCIPNFSFLKVP